MRWLRDKSFARRNYLSGICSLFAHLDERHATSEGLKAITFIIFWGLIE